METRHLRQYDKYLKANSKGRLEFDGWDVVDLAKRYDTPLYVISERAIQDNYRALAAAIAKRYDRYQIAFGLKANHGLAVAKILQREGAGMDVVGMGELHTALRVGTDPKKMILNGNSKTLEEIETSVRIGVGLINVDGPDELEVISKAAARYDRTPSVAIRVKPAYDSIKAWDHEFYEEKKHSKFGITIEDGQAMDACRKALSLRHMKLVGFHHHSGWMWGLSDEPDTHLHRFKDAAEEVLDFAGEVKKKLGFRPDILDYGGGLNAARKEGFGPKMTKRAPTPDEFCETYISVIKRKCEQYGLGKPLLMFEPGRYLVQNAGILLGKVGSVKTDKGGSYVNVDMSTNLLMNRLTNSFYHHGVVANKANDDLEMTGDVVGPICGGYDVVVRALKMPRPEPGDIIAVFDAGAYSESKATRFNAYPLPATVLVSDEGPELVRRRETYEDLSLHDLIPSRLLP